MLRLAALLALAPLASSCGPPSCPPVPVQLPAASAQLPWLAGPAAAVEVELSSRPLGALLDTGFPRSVIALSAASGIDLERAVVRLGGARAGPLSLGLSLALPVAAVQGVIGGDVLHQLPLVLDPRARTAEVRPRFSEPPPGAAPLDVWVTGRCQGDQLEAGPEGPHALVVEASLEGRLLRLLLDTGAAATLVRTGVAEALGPRPRLEGVRAISGFAGTFLATATRARLLAVGEGASTGSLLIAAPEVDRYLDWLQADLGGARCGERSTCPGPVDGLLGWSFLREFLVALDGGAGPTRGRTLHLARLSTQDHWQRELVGIGAYTSPSAEPPGLRIDGFLPGAPALEAGLLVGDVILTVDGVSATNAPSPFAPPGTTVTLEVARGASRLWASVPIRDLLPDPP